MIASSEPPEILERRFAKGQFDGETHGGFVVQEAASGGQFANGGPR